MAYEVEVKKIATFLNGKINVAGETIPEAWEQMILEWFLQAAVNITPETFRGLPLRQMAVSFALNWITDPEETTVAVANFLSSQPDIDKS